ncbi:fluconazole resistance protein 1 [Ophiostoma piceae UAMH 11346]|uniref:Fluconazole resistance protein 1 n=1 Tax=Ophiostoma piceae (strain UAMH 11346) TaxID=1262450 RepID=S3BXM1_OPHP1|nr:fluconazole resistance protein 1 [Ophiostoma piceae UAMH 11346]
MSSAPQPASSQASSITATGVTPASATKALNTDSDIEANNGPAPASAAPAHVPVASSNDLSHFQLVFKHVVITPAVRDAHYSGDGTEDSPYVVGFLPVDPRDPQQFPKWRKWMITIINAIATLAIAFVSTAYSGGLSEIMSTFHISSEVAIIGISLFVVGFAIGPLLWAPSSEFFGRQILFVITYIILTLFIIGAACAQNMATLIIMRFFAGSFGSSPLTNAGGVIADMFTASDRGLATAVFAAAPFLGPSLGPIVAGFLGDAAGWRWVEGLMAIFTGVMVIIGGLLVPETYAPLLLRKRAAQLSKMTGKVYISRMDNHHRLQSIAAGNPGGRGPSMSAQFRTALSRPWILLFREPIVFITSIYMAIIYGTMYMMFAAFPIIFQQTRGWSAGIGGLAFLGIAIGMVIAVIYAMWDNGNYNRRAALSPNGVAPPEARLMTAAIGSVLLPIGLFWFAWTNEAPIHWVVPIIGSGFFAAGLVLVFLSLFNYLIDSYVIFAASVLAANTVLRSLFGAAFPLFTTYMYKNLGLHWASSVPAFLAVACVPFPFLFMKYGERIRRRCKYASEAADVLERMRAAAAHDAAAASAPKPGTASSQPGADPIPEDEEEAYEEANDREKFRRSMERIASRPEAQAAEGSKSTQPVSDNEKVEK